MKIKSRKRIKSKMKIKSRIVRVPS